MRASRSLIFTLALLLFPACGAGRNEASVWINAPAAEIFPYLTHSDLAQKWIGGLQKLETAGETRYEPGTRTGAAMVVDGVEYKMEIEVLAYEENRHICLRITNEGFLSTAGYTLEEENGGTRIILVQDTIYITFMGRLFEPLVTSAAQAKIEKDLERLRGVLAPRAG